MTERNRKCQGSDRHSGSIWYSTTFGWAVAVVFPLTFLSIGAFCGYRSTTKDAGTEATTGSVIFMESWIDRENRRTRYIPVVAYWVGEQRFKCKGSNWSWLPPYKIGDRVPVRYRTNQPERGYINSPYELYYGPLVFFGFGLLTTIVIVIGRIKGRKADSRIANLPKTP